MIKPVIVEPHIQALWDQNLSIDLFQYSKRTYIWYQNTLIEQSDWIWLIGVWIKTCLDKLGSTVYSIFV